MQMLFMFFIANVALNYAVTDNSTLCVARTCHGDQCPEVRCDHGECDDGGVCKCHPCWTGDMCDEYVNAFHPKFASRFMGAYIKSNALPGSIIYDIQANDEDFKTTCNSQEPCDCSQMFFEIITGDSEGLFSIDPKNGSVILEKSIANVIDGRQYTVQISVVDKLVVGKGGDIVGPKEYATLKITIGDGLFDYEDEFDQSETVLDRYRRQAAIPASVSNITFTLMKTGVYNYTTTMKVGSKVHFQLQIQFPQSQTIDLSVELFTPENKSTIMILCKPQIVYSGSNLQYNTTSAQPVQDANDGSINYDRAVLNFGNVVNNGAGSGIANVIKVEWDVVMIDSEDTVNGSYYWVSAGAEYNQQNEIWVGQAGFVAILDNFNTSTMNPQFNMSGPSSIPLGTSALFKVDMYLPYPSIDLNFDAFAPFNFTDAASICSILISGVGINYECYNYLDRPLTLYPSDSGLTNERGSLYLGKVVNKGSREAVFNWTESRITIEFIIYIPMNDSLVGENLWIGTTLELGSDQIWAGQASFQVAAAVPSALLASPPTTKVYPADKSVSTYLYLSKALSLNVSLQPDTSSNYTLVFTTDGIKYRTCNAELKFKGDNIPCFRPSDPTFSTTSAGLETNQVEWMMGNLDDKNIRSTLDDPYANTIQVFLYVVPVRYTGMSINDQATVSGTFSGSNSQTSSFSQTLTLSNITDLTNATGSAAPTANVTFSFGSTTTNVNETVALVINIAFYPQVLNNPVTFTFQAPNSSTSGQFSIIRAEILSVGKNLPCSQQIKLNASFEYQSMPGSEMYHTAILRAGAVNNLAQDPRPGASFYPTSDDSIKVRVLIFFNDINPLPPSGIFSSSFSYTPSNSWNDSQTFSVGILQKFSYAVKDEPYVVYDYTLKDGTSVPAGQQFATKILIKTAPKSVADWSIFADVSHDPDLSLCSLYVLEYGYDISYVNLSTQARKVAGSTPGSNTNGWLELYKLSNIGNNTLNKTSTFDLGSIVIEVLVQVSKSSSASAKFVKLSVDYGMDGEDSNDNVNFNVIAAASYTYDAAGVVPNITFDQSKVNENSTTPPTNVYKGQTLILTTEFVYPLEYVSHTLAVQLLAPADDSVDVVEFNVVFVGQNFPCLEKKSSVRTLSKSGSNVLNNQGDLDLGNLCFVPINKRYPEQSKLRIEAIVTIVRDSPIATGSSILISSKISINGTVQSKDLTLTIVGAPPATKDFNLIGPNYATVFTLQDPVTMISHSTHTFNASINILANTSDVADVTLLLPMGSVSAVMTVVDFKVLSFGKNLGSITIPFPSSTVYISTKLTTQNDQASISLGRITNTGHTYRADIYTPGDDDVTVEVIVQMADAKEAIDGTPELVTYNFNYLGIVATNSSKVVASKPSTDTIDLLLTPIVDSTTVYNGGDQVSIVFHLMHNNQSRAEPFDANFIFYFPKFFDFNPPTFQQDFINPVSPTMNFNAGDKFFFIYFPHIYFTDNITFSFQLQILPNQLTSNAPQEIIRLAYEIEMSANPKSTPTTPGTGMTYPISFINLTVTATSQQACPAQIALGMADATIIQDCQITGSPGINDYVSARPNAAGWIAGLRKGPFTRYLQIRMRDKNMITKISITQTTTNRIKDILMSYSNDGINWVNGDLITAPDTSTATDIAIPNPVTYYYVRINIATTYNPDTMPGFTVEIWGCTVTPTTLTASQLCDKRNGWQDSTIPMEEFYTRGLASENSKGIMCDTLPNNEDMKCFSSSNGFTWQALDETVINILGYASSTNRLYGLDKNKMAVVMSEDDGKTWATVSKAYYLKAKTDPGFQSVKSIPWNSQMTPVVQGAFSAKYDGLYYNTFKVADWMDCCS